MSIDPRLDTAQCRSCKAPIIWATTTNGKRMTINAAPVDAGNIRLVYRRGDNTPIAHVVAKAERVNYGTDQAWYTSHFASCPDADTWRKRGDA